LAVLVPLDYYRILGLPTQATPEQLRQAYQDRVSRGPRRDYSQLAVTARQDLLDEAYRTLGDPLTRQDYDAAFLNKTYGVEAIVPEETGRRANGTTASQSPALDIDDRQFVGAIALLQELGEYELVLNLGYPHLSNPGDIEAGRFGEPKLVLADVVLSVVLAYLELGREQWHQNQSEQAASSLKIAQELLLHHGLFASLRGEIQGDLYKLRPYRILELLAHPDPAGVAHRQGLQLLRSMLKERDGIDGHGDDRSALNVEEFLRFIQQIRPYLLVQEQLAIFEAEARRPSAVATYLTAYGLIAQGFCLRQPAAIQRASVMLRRLGSRQDVFLEQAVCSLLLGRPDEACQLLERSQEQEPIEAVRQLSLDPADLLPGLCSYCERWLGTEVLPYFRDLAAMEASLTAYFSDGDVQRYLEALPDREEESGDRWTVVPPEPEPGVAEVLLGDRAARPPLSTLAAMGDRPALDMPSFSAPRSLPIPGSSSGPGSPLPPPLRPVLSGPLGERPGPPPAPIASAPAPSVPVPSALPPRSVASGGGAPSALEGGSGWSEIEGGGALPPLGSAPRRRAGLRDRRGRSGGGDRPGRMALVVVGGVVVFGIAGWFVLRVYGAIASLFQDSGPPIEAGLPAVQLDRPPIDIPDPQQVTAPPAATSVDLTPEAARDAIEGWLAAKSAAMGRDYAIAALDAVLVDPMLTRWRGQAREAQGEGVHWQYEHSLEVLEVIPEAAGNSGTAVVRVNEKATKYRGETVLTADSYDSALQARYALVRQDGKWQVKDVRVTN
jgi:hypothetical protein